MVGMCKGKRIIIPSSHYFMLVSRTTNKCKTFNHIRACLWLDMVCGLIVFAHSKSVKKLAFVFRKDAFNTTQTAVSVHAQYYEMSEKPSHKIPHMLF